MESLTETLGANITSPLSLAALAVFCFFMVWLIKDTVKPPEKEKGWATTKKGGPSLLGVIVSIIGVLSILYAGAVVCGAICLPVAEMIREMGSVQ